MRVVRRKVRWLSLIPGLVPLAMAAAQQPPDTVHAKVQPSTSFWLGAQADLVGLPGPSGSPALYGANGAIAHRLGDSPWEAALVLSAASRRKAAPSPNEPSYHGSTYGLSAELRYVPGRVRGPYVFGALGLANTRVDDRFAGSVPGVGTDATTGIIGAGVGLRFRALRVGGFADIQYQLRTTATHGRHALPVRLGFRW